MNSFLRIILVQILALSHCFALSNKSESNYLHLEATAVNPAQEDLEWMEGEDLELSKEEEKALGIIDMAEYAKSQEAKEAEARWQNRKIEEIAPGSKEELKYLKLLNDFLSQENFNKEYERYLTSARKLLDDIPPDYLDKKLTKLLSEKLQKVNDLPYTKYRDYVFSKYGFVINGGYHGYHALLLQVENSGQWVNLPFKEETLTIRYQIIPDRQVACSEDITNMSIVFLNDDRFEIFRFFVGDLKEGCSSTGKFEISKKQYEELRSIKSITDQDTCEPFISLGLSAIRYR